MIIVLGLCFIQASSCLAQYSATLITSSLFSPNATAYWVQSTPRINDNLVVTGSVLIPMGGGYPEAFIWSPTTGLVSLQSGQPNLLSSWTSALSNNSDIAGGGLFALPVGYVVPLVLSPTLGAFTWSASPLPSSPGYSNVGQILDFSRSALPTLAGVGRIDFSSPWPRALFMLNDVGYLIGDYVASPAGYLRNLTSAEAISDNGRICGRSDAAGDSIGQAYVFDINSFSVLDLPGQTFSQAPLSFAMTGSEAHDLNDNFVVGASVWGYNSTQRNLSAAYWDINTAALTLLPASGPLSAAGSGQSIARAINSANVIGGATADGATIWNVNSPVGTLLNSSNVSGLSSSHVLTEVVGISNPTAQNPNGCFLVKAAIGTVYGFPSALYLIC